MADEHDKLKEAVAAIGRRSYVKPRIAIVLGSGLGPLADEVEGANAIPYRDITYMPHSTAPGHSGKLVLGQFEGQPVAMFSGRAHLYEGYTPQEVAFGVRLARMLGAEALIVTNAAGAVNLEFQPGQLMLISDHINLTGQSPLVGENDARFGVRFPDMSEAYDRRLRELAERVGKQAGLPLVEGIYLGALGPSYETPAEIRMARLLGADAVGMSTVLEVIVANHVGMRVLGISLLSNMAAGILPQKLTEEEVIETAHRARDEFAALVRGVVREYDPVGTEGSE